MDLAVDVQYACGRKGVPGKRRIASWVRAALGDRSKPATLTVRVVDEAEGEQLNRRWRNRPHATNVLSFSASTPQDVVPELLGDIVICRPVVEREAAGNAAGLEAHWAHLVVHGTLHLLGYDHENDRDANLMEQREVDVLGRLGYPDPYA